MIPAQYEAKQTIAQWKPQVNRYMAIAPQQDRIDFDWKLGHLVKTTTGRSELRQRILAKWPRAVAYLFRGKEKYHLCGRSVFPAHRLREYTPWMRSHSGLIESDLFLMDLCRRQQSGFFSVCFPAFAQWWRQL